jgi:hypothetical protein
MIFGRDILKNAQRRISSILLQKRPFTLVSNFEFEKKIQHYQFNSNKISLRTWLKNFHKKFRHQSKWRKRKLNELNGERNRILKLYDKDPTYLCCIPPSIILYRLQ